MHIVLFMTLVKYLYLGHYAMRMHGRFEPLKLDCGSYLVTSCN